MNHILEDSSSLNKIVNPEPILVTQPIKRKRVRWNRNWPCICNSGKKFKKCCMKDIEALDLIDGNVSYV